VADAGGFDYWRGDEQAPLPAQGADAGGFDYWRGGELLPVYSETSGVTPVSVDISTGGNQVVIV
jgi:hypothetical protein